MRTSMTYERLVSGIGHEDRARLDGVWRVRTGYLRRYCRDHSHQELERPRVACVMVVVVVQLKAGYCSKLIQLSPQTEGRDPYIQIICDIDQPYQSLSKT